ncbi:MAG: sigma-70 family RNA polymerase sigma factor [Spirochaetota bacterium]
MHEIWAAMAPRIDLYLRSFSSLSVHEQEDVLQEVMVALWRDGPDDESAIRPWLYRVARNRAIDALRHTKRIQAHEQSFPEGSWILVDQLPAVYPSPEDAALSAEDSSFVRDFLADLEDRDREILHLAFAEDLAYCRIAELLNLPLGTIKWKIASLKRRLAVRYRKEFS